ncbi:hypothetical protein PHLGIDRAFT_268191 [Phlebiopsis gigantea 11061_1 CR5-6]|uniref:Uncharacterized protein n=1 Tax=Phlebiopsis gigantea (strain 11061_1 CR5-6) TaxID=745531 RepID=A0A0C3S1B9_PHLG1|nr:hypothetical protein PHLGIDRAFT_268191 [Phlebiopsis gigantea 11061_1 CR5-6]
MGVHERARPVDPCPSVGDIVAVSMAYALHLGGRFLETGDIGVRGTVSGQWRREKHPRATREKARPSQLRHAGASQARPCKMKPEYQTRSRLKALNGPQMLSVKDQRSLYYYRQHKSSERTDCDLLSQMPMADSSCRRGLVLSPPTDAHADKGCGRVGACICAARNEAGRQLEWEVNNDIGARRGKSVLPERSRYTYKNDHSYRLVLLDPHSGRTFLM